MTMTLNLKLSRLSLKKFWKVGLSLTVIGGLSVIPIRIAITSAQVPQPQAILVLNGNPSRIKYAAKLWRSHPDFHIWVSAESDRAVQHYGRIFAQAGIPPNQIHYDRCATDTVTNFTCTVNDFQQQQKQHLYLITSDYHMARSRAIATLVLGSRGIIVSPIPVASKNFPPESRWRIARDCIRALIWILTGRTGASLNPRLNSENTVRSAHESRFHRVPPGNFGESHG